MGGWQEILAWTALVLAIGLPLPGLLRRPRGASCGGCEPAARTGSEPRVAYGPGLTRALRRSGTRGP